MAITPSAVKIFDSMEYGPIMDGDSLAKEWLDSKSKRLHSIVPGGSDFGVGQCKTYKVNDFHSSQLLAEVADATPDQIELAVQSSVSAFERWSGLKPYVRARHLYKYALRTNN